jgi:isochorismate hydrolase
MAKQEYVTIQNLNRAVRRWKRQIAGYERHPYDIGPDKIALLVIDMQSYFTSPESHAYIPASRAIIPMIRRLVAGFRAHRRPVIYTRHLDRRGREGLMGVWWNAPINESDPFSRLDRRMDISGCAVLRKSRYSAFAKTSLEETLMKKGVTTMAIAGVMTHLCCETTARDAFIHDFQVVFLMDATATQDEALHLSSLRNLADGFAEVMTCKELEERLRWDEQ